MSYAAETPYLPQKPSGVIESEDRTDSRLPASSFCALIPTVDAIASGLGRFAALAKRFKEHRPFQLLAIIAGAGFVLGSTVRIWKERS
jgi:hypothetical protein